MKDSFRRLMSGILDYAGVFPPASLTVSKALEQYAGYRSGRDAWMLNAFVVDIARLEELPPLLARLKPPMNGPLELSVVGSFGHTEHQCLEALEHDMAILERFLHAQGEHVRVKSLELKLPSARAVPEGRLLEEMYSRAANLGLNLFLEITSPLDDGWTERLPDILDSIAEQNTAARMPAGMKLRTGGTVSEAFPSSRQVADMLTGCRDRRIPLKFTAGLHHPVRMFRTEVQGMMHGFLNMFAGGMMAHYHGLPAAEVADIVEDSDPGHFRFTDEGISWRHLTVPAEEITRLRGSLLLSFGSCSFDEPREDLRQLGWLP